MGGRSRYGSSRSGEDGVEDAFGGHFAEDGHHERDGRHDQRCGRAHESAGVSGCGGVPDLAVKEEEIAETLGSSPRTVKRRWRFARAWLQQHMLEETS